MARRFDNDDEGFYEGEFTPINSDNEFDEDEIVIENEIPARPDRQQQQLALLPEPAQRAVVQPPQRQQPPQQLAVQQRPAIEIREVVGHQNRSQVNGGICFLVRMRNLQISVKP